MPLNLCTEYWCNVKVVSHFNMTFWRTKRCEFVQLIIAIIRSERIYTRYTGIFAPYYSILLGPRCVQYLLLPQPHAFIYKSSTVYTAVVRRQTYRTSRDVSLYLGESHFVVLSVCVAFTVCQQVSLRLYVHLVQCHIYLLSSLAFHSILLPQQLMELDLAIWKVGTRNNDDV